eukprot:553524-Rhodomonas_salina.1
MSTSLLAGCAQQIRASCKNARKNPLFGCLQLAMWWTHMVGSGRGSERGAARFIVSMFVHSALMGICRSKRAYSTPATPCPSPSVTRESSAHCMRSAAGRREMTAPSKTITKVDARRAVWPNFSQVLQCCMDGWGRK